MTKFKITSHGWKRLFERLPRIPRHRYETMVKCAWSSKETSETVEAFRERNKKQPRKFEYRLYGGVIYVYDAFTWKGDVQIVKLVTAFQHQSIETVDMHEQFNKWSGVV